MSTYTVETIVHGYHVYRAVWEAAVGQVLPCQQERGNALRTYLDKTRDVCHTLLGMPRPKFRGENFR